MKGESFAVVAVALLLLLLHPVVLSSPPLLLLDSLCQQGAVTVVFELPYQSHYFIKRPEVIPLLVLLLSHAAVFVAHIVTGPSHPLRYNFPSATVSFYQRQQLI